jgi:hypothetical protein
LGVSQDVHRLLNRPPSLDGTDHLRVGTGLTVEGLVQELLRIVGGYRSHVFRLVFATEVELSPVSAMAQGAGAVVFELGRWLHH